MIKNKKISQLVCLTIYIISFYISFLLTPVSISNVWLKITIWHLYATLFIYIGSVILKNSSFSIFKTKRIRSNQVSIFRKMKHPRWIFLTGWSKHVSSSQINEYNNKK